MEIILANHAGACYGVKRALDLAEEAAQHTQSAQTLGPLIHNPLVVADLEDKGVKVAQSISDIQASTVIIRSHGVTPEVYDQLEALNVDVIDATCPHVLRAQRAAYDLSSAGYTVLVVGEADHPEVQGLQAWAARGGSPVVVAADPSDLPGDIGTPLGIVVQTTQSDERLQGIIDELDARHIAYDLRNTICSATSKRQIAGADLAQQVDAMVVIGGHNSSNTTRLAEVCGNYVDKVFHIESCDELQKEDFEGIKTLGVTAGASTPDVHIQAVVDCLRTMV